MLLMSLPDYCNLHCTLNSKKEKKRKQGKSLKDNSV